MSEILIFLKALTYYLISLFILGANLLLCEVYRNKNIIYIYIINSFTTLFMALVLLSLYNL